MKNIDFTKLDYRAPAPSTDATTAYAEWRRGIEAATGKPLDELHTQTMEQIPVKPLYTAADYQGMEHLGFTAGLPPFLRGPYATMYVMRPWTVRQYAGFSTAEESNAFYRRN
ncbi:MAG: methylmalonyl-CoA mutase family protein, partial [Puniceicoccales bacterium]|nr:methylmalonyl-CoA mutase family protein [Puniceicoccales bacterium]